MNLDVVKLNPTEWIQRAYRLNLTRIPSSYPTSCPTFRIWLIENKQIPDSLSRPHCLDDTFDDLFFLFHAVWIRLSDLYTQRVSRVRMCYDFSRKSFSCFFRIVNGQENLLRFPFRIVWIIDLDRPWWNRLKKHLQYFHSNWERNLLTVKLTFYSCRWRKKGERDVTPRSIYPFKRTEYNLLLLVTGTRN